MMAYGPQNHFRYAIWDLIPLYLGSWTLYPYMFAHFLGTLYFENPIPSAVSLTLLDLCQQDPSHPSMRNEGLLAYEDSKQNNGTHDLHSWALGSKVIWSFPTYKPCQDSS